MPSKVLETPTKNIAEELPGNLDTARPGRGPLQSRWRWLIPLIVVAIAGLALRLATGVQPVSLFEWLPWLNPPTVTVYFPDSQVRFLVPVTRRVAEEKATPAGAIEELLKGPNDHQMLTALFLPPARLINFEIQDGLALVEVTTDSSDERGSLPALITIEAVALTLDKLEGIEMVRLLLNGDTLAESPVPPHGAEASSLFYTYGSYLVPVSAQVSNPEETIHRYLEGAGLPALVGLPDDVRLLDYRFDADRGLVYTNFSYTESVRKMALADPEGLRRSLIGIIATLTAFPEVKAIMLDFEGHSRLGLGQCADLLRAPQLAPRILNDEAILLRR